MEKKKVIGSHGRFLFSKIEHSHKQSGLADQDGGYTYIYIIYIYVYVETHMGLYCILLLHLFPIYTCAHRIDTTYPGKELERILIRK